MATCHELPSLSMSTWGNPIMYGFAIGVGSNFRRQPFVDPGIVRVGEPLRLIAGVRECGFPVTGCAVTVDVAEGYTRVTVDRSWFSSRASLRCSPPYTLFERRGPARKPRPCGTGGGGHPWFGLLHDGGDLPLHGTASWPVGADCAAGLTLAMVRSRRGLSEPCGNAVRGTRLQPRGDHCAATITSAGRVASAENVTSMRRRRTRRFEESAPQRR